MIHQYQDYFTLANSYMLALTQLAACSQIGLSEEKTACAHTPISLVATTMLYCLHCIWPFTACMHGTAFQVSVKCHSF